MQKSEQIWKIEFACDKQVSQQSLKKVTNLVSGCNMRKVFVFSFLFFFSYLFSFLFFFLFSLNYFLIYILINIFISWRNDCWSLFHSHSHSQWKMFEMPFWGDHLFVEFVFEHEILVFGVGDILASLEGELVFVHAVLGGEEQCGHEVQDAVALLLHHFHVVDTIRHCTLIYWIRTNIVFKVC